MELPKVIILISGKRKCGKDYISEKLLKQLTNENSTIVRISEPIKSHYAQAFDLDLTQLLSDGAYKEKYRLDMINWSEKIRNKDYGYFCKNACNNVPLKKVWIVSDIRRKTDLKWFRENYGDKIQTIRINADTSVRQSRGWEHTTGVDDVSSECDLDDVNDWDSIFLNNSNEEAQHIIESLCDIIQKYF